MITRARQLNACAVLIKAKATVEDIRQAIDRELKY